MEPVNGALLEDTLKYGIVDLRSDPKTGKVTVRIGKPLLRIIAEQCRLFKVILQNPYPVAVLPEQVEQEEGHLIGRLFDTCQPYSPDTQEATTLVSWLVTLYSWLSTTLDRPPATLLALRPGALVFGNKGLAAAVVPALERAAQAVDQVTESDVRKRDKEALRWVPKLVTRDTVDPQPGEACFLPTNTFGADTVIRLAMPPVMDPNGAVCDGGVLLGQQKGVITGPSVELPVKDNILSPKEAIAFLRKIALVAQHGVQRTRAVHGEKKKKRSKSVTYNALACELLTVRKASPTMRKTLEEQLSGERHCLVVITRDELATALGAVFGGIVARANDN
jgi:hypothetical protein